MPDSCRRHASERASSQLHHRTKFNSRYMHGERRMNRITLNGCTPDVLIHYLKALGVLRLVGEQFDERVRGAWRGSAFIIESEKTADELIDFFLNKYHPTPIVAPWYNGSGFHSLGKGKGKTDTTLPAIKNSTTSRLQLYRETIEEAKNL